MSFCQDNFLPAVLLLIIIIMLAPIMPYMYYQL